MMVSLNSTVLIVMLRHNHYWARTDIDVVQQLAYLLYQYNDWVDML